MKQFDRFRLTRRTIQDPTFGILEYHESGCWRGDVPLETGGEDIGIEIRTRGPEPVESHRRRFLDMRQGWTPVGENLQED